MIYHHLNMACLNELDIFETKHKKEELFFIDSVSLAMISRFLGCNKPRVPGSIHIDKLSQNPEQSLFLTAKKIGFQNEVVLPVFRNFDEIARFDFRSLVKTEVENLSPKSCFIGISSPKQNKVAQELQKIWPDIDYYCIGAVIDTKVIENKVLINTFSKYGGEFLLHLFWSPKRFVKKIFIMFKFFFRLIYSKKFRKEIQNILSNFSNSTF